MTVDDLSEGTLSELEAKLVADLGMVRRVLALLRELRAGTPAQATASQSRMSPSTAPPTSKPSKPHAESIRDALLALPGETFRPEAFRVTLRKEGSNPSSARMRILLSKLVRQGVIEVAELGKGRSGSLYRRLITRPEESISGVNGPIQSPALSIKLTV